MLIAVVATFSVTLVLCGFAGFGLYGMAERERALQAARSAAEIAAVEAAAEQRLARADKQCEERLARERVKCAEARVPVRPSEKYVAEGDSPAKAFASVLRTARTSRWLR